MLYNQNWQKPQRDILSLDSLIKWLESKPRLGRYKYTNTEHCVLAQYFTAMGGVGVSVGANSCHYHIKGEWHHKNLPERWNEIALGNIFLFKTFGGALRRARRLRAKQRSIFALTQSPEDHISDAHASLEQMH